MNVDDKVVVVTGGGNGIGRHLVFELLRRGAKVAAVDIRQESLEETAAMVRTGALGPVAPGAEDRLGLVVADVTDRASCDALPGRVEGALGPADCLINNAGIIQPFVRFNDLEFSDIDRVIRVNLYGPLQLIEGVPARSAGTTGGPHRQRVEHGRLPAGAGSNRLRRDQGGDQVAERGFHAELAETNVGVTVIMPGGVSTEITTNSGVESPIDPEEAENSRIPTTSPSDAATAIVDGIEHDRLYVYIGVDSKLMNLATRVAPRQASTLIRKQMKGLLDRS